MGVTIRSSLHQDSMQHSIINLSELNIDMHMHVYNYNILYYMYM